MLLGVTDDDEGRTLMLEACTWRCICIMASTLKKLALQAGVRIQGTMQNSRTSWKRRLR